MSRPAGMMGSYLIRVPLLILISIAGWAQTPFDIVPGGVKPDYYAPRDMEAYVSFRFAGESDWWTSHRVLIRKGEGLTFDGRRAKCGNKFSQKLPPDARILPPTIRFVERLPLLPPRAPDLVLPDPERFDFPPGPLPPLSEAAPWPEATPAYVIGGFWIPPGGLLHCDKKNQDSKDCKSHPKPPPAAVPEPSSGLLFATGVALLLSVLAFCLRRTRRLASLALISVPGSPEQPRICLK